MNKKIFLSAFFTLVFSLCSCNTAKQAENTDKSKEQPISQISHATSAKLAPIQVYDKEEELNGTTTKLEAQYFLRTGDKIEISVLDEPEMTRQVFVLPDGSINYLLVGKLQAAGKTAEELASSLTTLLSKYLINPNVSVLVVELKVSEHLSLASVLGAVQRPGQVEIKKGDRLIDIISKAGGLLYINDIGAGRSVANLNASYISRDGVRLDVNFDSLLRLGDMGQNIIVKDGDVIYFAESDTNNIIVLGEVENPNIIPFTRDVSLIEAISRCGGFTDKAQKGSVIVLRKEGEEPKMVKIDLDAILNGREKLSNLALKSGDVVFIPEQGLSEYEKYASQIMTFADLVLKGYQVREQIRFPRIHRRDSYFY